MEIVFYCADVGRMYELAYIKHLDHGKHLIIGIILTNIESSQNIDSFIVHI